jgi:nucleoside phosphorylase
MSNLILSKVRSWIVSAWQPEQKFLFGELSRGRSVETVSSNLQVVGPYAFLTTGIGTPRASMALGSGLTAAANAGAQTHSVFFVATAGSYESAISMNSAHAVSSALWSDAALAAQQSYLPKVEKYEQLNSEIGFGNSSVEGSLRVLSTPGITLDPVVAARFGGFAELENLEIYGIALAASFFNVRWNSVLGVSNVVGRAAHAQWKANHEMASLAAQRKLMELFPEELSQ